MEPYWGSDPQTVLQMIDQQMARIVKDIQLMGQSRGVVNFFALEYFTGTYIGAGDAGATLYGSVEASSTPNDLIAGFVVPSDAYITRAYLFIDDVLTAGSLAVTASTDVGSVALDTFVPATGVESDVRLELIEDNKVPAGTSISVLYQASGDMAPDQSLLASIELTYV